MSGLRRVLVVAAIIEKNGKVLVSLRRPKGERASLWEFPGGKVEPGEGERAALARELREELGVSAAIGEEYGRVEHIYPDVQVELALFRCTLHAGPEPQPLACEEVRWVSHRDLPGLPFCEADVPILTRLAEEEQALPATGGARMRGALEEQASPATGGARTSGALEEN